MAITKRKDNQRVTQTTRYKHDLANAIVRFLALPAKKIHSVTYEDMRNHDGGICAGEREVMKDLYRDAMQVIADCRQPCRGDGSHFGQAWKAPKMIADLIGVDRDAVISNRLHEQMRREAWEASLAHARRVSSNKIPLKGDS